MARTLIGAQLALWIGRQRSIYWKEMRAKRIALCVGIRSFDDEPYAAKTFNELQRLRIRVREHRMALSHTLEFLGNHIEEQRHPAEYATLLTHITISQVLGLALLRMVDDDLVIPPRVRMGVVNDLADIRDRHPGSCLDKLLPIGGAQKLHFE